MISLVVHTQEVHKIHELQQNGVIIEMFRIHHNYRPIIIWMTPY
jgi:hypothetical protein